jgi:hypothetical protein
MWNMWEEAKARNLRYNERETKEGTTMHWKDKRLMQTSVKEKRVRI